MSLWSETSCTFLSPHPSGLYPPLHTANFPALCLVLQGKICTYLIKLKTQAMTSKSKWLDKTFFMTYPETLQLIAHIVWYIHEFFPCLSWAEKEKMPYALWKPCIHLYILWTDRWMCPLQTSPSASQGEQICMLVYSDERLEIRTI